MTEDEYAPLPVPERTLNHPSIRDDVRRTIRSHNFQPSSTHFTPITNIYRLYLQDTDQVPRDSPELEDKFRSALGRVLRPPENSGQYALSFHLPNLRRSFGAVSIVSPDTERIDPKEETKRLKYEKGVRQREKARTSNNVAGLRAKRKAKVIFNAQNPAPEDPPQQISFRYMDEFVALNSAEDLMRLKVFPNGKELAESMSAYSAVRQYLHVHKTDHEETDGILSFRDKNVLLLAVGDGCTPRTATLFAFRSAWRCVSIDPAMKSEGAWSSVSNLQTVKSKVQDVTIPVASGPDNFERVVVVMWHCHVSIKEALGSLEFEGTKWDISNKQLSHELRKRVALVTCACCNFDSVQRTMPDGSPPDVEFEDIAVPGLMRTVRVWKYLQ